MTPSYRFYTPFRAHPMTILPSLRSSRAWRAHFVAVVISLAAACAPAPVETTPAPARVPPGELPPMTSMLDHAIIPRPRSVEITATDSFVVGETTVVRIDQNASEEVERIARQLGVLLAGPAAPAPERLPAGVSPPAGSIHLRLDPARSELGAEGYELEVNPERVTLVAAHGAGLFYATQSLRQLLPWSVEHHAALRRTLAIPVARVSDAPRFGWRGSMLDISRHFLPVSDVMRFVDYMALYKLNRLHLHLSDDQGWRIEIASWPNLARLGGSTQVGGGPGGYWTQAEYAALVRYAQERYITIVPEIDMPGHTNAALASYPELNCDGVAPPLYTGTRVGFSTLCVDREVTYRFVDDVVRELSAITPGAWFHIGGDEVERLTPEQYRAFVERVQGIVHSHGKRMIGWGEIAPAQLDPSTVIQHWKRDSSVLHVRRGGTVILSPATRVYLDMKYDSLTVLGLRWAALLEVRDSYDWEPAAQIEGVPESHILGVEAPLWSETLVKREDFEFMAFPRLAAVAEVGWSAAADRAWEDFRLRLHVHGPRMAAKGINFYRSPQVW